MAKKDKEKEEPKEEEKTESTTQGEGFGGRKSSEVQ